MDVIVYTDGSCFGNGYPNAQGGFGIYCREDPSLTCYGPLPPKSQGFLHTSQRAELYAILTALQKTRNIRRKLIIRSDSEYAMKSVNEWLPKWRDNGFRTANNTPVPDRDLLETIDQLIKERGQGKFAFEKVDGHSGDPGNDEAHRCTAVVHAHFCSNPMDLIVYTDGSCPGNGYPSARGGYGVYCREDSRLTCHGPLPPSQGFLHTSNRAELYAILTALQMTRHIQRKLIIRSDSDYSMQCLQEWLPKWRRNKFMTAEKTPVKNADLIVPIDQLIQERGEGKFAFEKVPAHSGDYGNDQADRLADLGAQQVPLYN